MIVGLEICGDTVRAVRLGRSRVSGAAQLVELPLDAGAVPVARVAEALGAHKAVWGVAVPSSYCSYRTISLPYNAPGRVVATYRYALEGRLPGSIEDYCIDALSEPRAAGDKGCRLTVAACPKDRVRDLVEQLKGVGADPCVMQPAVLALARRLRGAVPNGLILRVGPEIELAVMQQGELVAADVLPPISADGAAALIDRLRFSLRAMELSWGEFSLERCILISSQEPCEGLNEPSQGTDIAAALNAALGIPIEPPPDEIGGPAFAAAWGIAAQTAGKAHLVPNLLQGELAHPAHAQRYERRAAIALSMAIGIVLLLGIWSLRQFLDARATVRASQSREEELFSKLLPGVKGEITLDAMNAELARLRSEGAGDGASGGSVISAWKELISLTPAGVTFDQIDINSSRITLRARSTGSAWNLQNALLKSTMLKPGEPSNVYPAGGGVSTFSLDVRYK